jgi:hypothetical protein
MADNVILYKLSRLIQVLTFMYTNWEVWILYLHWFECVLKRFIPRQLRAQSNKYIRFAKKGIRLIASYFKTLTSELEYEWRVMDTGNYKPDR